MTWGLNLWGPFFISLLDYFAKKFYNLNSLRPDNLNWPDDQNHCWTIAGCWNSRRLFKLANWGPVNPKNRDRHRDLNPNSRRDLKPNSRRDLNPNSRNQRRSSLRYRFYFLGYLKPCFFLMHQQVPGSIDKTPCNFVVFLDLRFGVNTSFFLGYATKKY